MSHPVLGSVESISEFNADCNTQIQQALLKPTLTATPQTKAADGTGVSEPSAGILGKGGRDLASRNAGPRPVLSISRRHQLPAGLKLKDAATTINPQLPRQKIKRKGESQCHTQMSGKKTPQTSNSITKIMARVML